jgi:putative flavoprotein involved in K+ transport
MARIDTIIVGAGQAGLALSRCLSERGREHVLFERGRIGERWRSERWDSLRLLTPNWLSRLPGHPDAGRDPDGFMTRTEVVDYLADYARAIDAPVRERTAVVAATPYAGGWRVVTDQGTWTGRRLVVANGDCDRPRLPSFACELPGALEQVTPTTYRNPAALPAGGVLVVGASASGVQLADELRRAGREVVIAVGRHNRLPRRYRGRDVFHWLDRQGVLDRTLDEMPDAEEARREPSLQLAGGDPAETLDLARLAARGVRLAGRLTGIAGWRAGFAGDLPLTTRAADLRLRRLLDRIDRHIAAHGLDRRLPPAEPVAPVAAGAGPAEIDLRAAGIRTVVWATGYRPSYPWLHAPVFDRGGGIVHLRGRTAVPGLYVLGLHFLIRRRSNFLGGVGLDAAELAREITSGREERAA